MYHLQLHIYLIKSCILGPKYRGKCIRIIFSIFHLNYLASFQGNDYYNSGELAIEHDKALQRLSPKLLTGTCGDLQMLIPNNTQQGSSGFGSIKSGMSK